MASIPLNTSINKLIITTRIGSGKKDNKTKNSKQLNGRNYLKMMNNKNDKHGNKKQKFI